MSMPMGPNEPHVPSAPGTESHDYLWDRSGPPDPLVQELESLLAPCGLRQTETPLAPTPRSSPTLGRWRGFFSTSRVLPLAAILALAIGIAAWYGLKSPARDGWEVSSVQGDPRAGGRTLAPGWILPVLEWLETDEASSARVKVAHIGTLDVSANSRLRIQETGRDKHQVELAHGRIQATINAPARVFFVQTRAALATDMGCRYDLAMPESGPGILTVTAGWVLLEGNDKAWEARVPRGVSCIIDETNGPGTPFRAESAALRALLAALDERGWSDVTDDELRSLLEKCGRSDGVTLWHLLHRVPREHRDAVYGRISALFSLPREVKESDVLALKPDAMERLWGRVAWD